MKNKSSDIATAVGLGSATGSCLSRLAVIGLAGLVLLSSPQAAQADCTATLSGGSVTFTGDDASDTLTLGQQGGLLTHTCSARGDAGLASAVDFDSRQPGEQTLSVAQIGSITINGGAGSDTLVINNPAGSVFAPGATILYNGQDGYDVLVVQGAGGPDLRATYVPGPTSDAGVIETTSGALR